MKPSTADPTYPTIVDGVVFELTEAEARAGHVRFVLGDRGADVRAGERVYQRLRKRVWYARRRAGREAA